MWKQVKDALNQSATGFITRLASLLPGFVALSPGVSDFAGIGLDCRMRGAPIALQRAISTNGWRIGVCRPCGEWSPAKSPTLLVSGAIAVAIVVAGLLIGVAAFDSELTSELVRSVFAYVPNMMGAILVLLVGTVAARFLARSVLIGAVNLNLEYARLLSAGVKCLVNVLAVAMALEHLRIAVGIVELAFGILFGGIVLALALAVGLGSKDLVTKSLKRDRA